MNENSCLDVEDDEHRQERIRALLEKLNSDSKAQTPSEPPKFDFGDRSTFAVEPPSELLSRVQAFLPQLQASNEALAQRAEEDPDSVNIEHITDDTDHYIEMNLGLGVFEQRHTDPKAREDEDTEMSTSSTSSSSEAPGMDHDGTDTESDMSSEIITSFVPARPIRPLPRRSLNKPRPQITVLEDKPQS